jgi:hypothetical protein
VSDACWILCAWVYGALLLWQRNEPGAPWAAVVGVVVFVLVGLGLNDWLRARKRAPRTPADELYGRQAQAARREVLNVRLAQRRLLREWRQAQTDEERAAIDRLLDDNVAELDRIEMRYFGGPNPDRRDP